MFLGLSLTTWAIVLGIFAIVTPMAGKQIAKDSLRIKDDLLRKSFTDNFSGRWLFPFSSNNQCSRTTYGEAPIQKLTEGQYVIQMMIGGVWIKFLINLFALIFIAVVNIVCLIIQFGFAAFRGIFSTK